jgi:hypothetical protein
MVGLASCLQVGQPRALSWGFELSHIMHRAAPSLRTPPQPKSLMLGKVQTYSAVGSAEAVDLLLGAVELVLRGEGLEDLDDVVPELLVVLVQEDDEAGGLRVKRGGDMEKCLLNELLDFLVRDWCLLVELVVCAALLDGLDDRL